MDLSKIVIPLLDWYEKNARNLPWRTNTDPYRVWVSEIMLQQTRVETVKPYFLHFIQELPTLQHLAQAPDEKILKLWEGLGYYSRVRNMKKAAQQICKDYKGIFPGNFQDMLSLPGIGTYTAGAICSIAFGQPVPAVDGNVLRVMTRLTQDGTDITQPAFKKTITAKLSTIYPDTKCGEFTQSLMELGALICIPTEPSCSHCPLQSLCQSALHGTQNNYPVIPAKKERAKEIMTVLLLYDKDKVAIRKRPDSGLLRGLWEFPHIAGNASINEITAYLKHQGISAQSPQQGIHTKHIFTHVEWEMTSYMVPCTAGGTYLWVTKNELYKSYTLPTAFKKFLRTLPL